MDLVADRGLDFKLSPCRQAKIDLVEGVTSDPASFRDARDRDKPHSSRLANNIQDSGNRLNIVDRIDVCLEIMHGFERSL